MAERRAARRARLAWAAWALLAALPAARAQTTFLAKEEQIEFFPADAVLDAERDVWIAPVHAVVFEPERDGTARRSLLQALANALHLPADSPGSAIFQERAASFLPDRETDVRLTLKVAGQTVRVGPSGTDGHVHGTVEIPGPVVRVLPPAEQSWLTLALALPSGSTPRANGTARLLPPTGLSIVSDVGDTVVIAHTTDRKRMLARIFLDPFQAVPGMAALYARAAEEGAAFHYISLGPWQLHGPLTAFLSEAGFPRGTLLLRELHAQEVEPWDWFEDAPGPKRQAVTAIATQWPGRTLILVGDSGDQSPEQYGEAFRRWPERIERILIRDVSGDERDGKRYRAAFRDVPPERWVLFKDASELDSLRGPPPPPPEPAGRGSVPPLTR